jgi:histidyl-tRNA synthetase
VPEARGEVVPEARGEVVPEARGEKDTEPWLSLRYDLTAPLARYVAQNFQTLVKPFRRYAVGNVWRNEKPGPGRFREFLQFDADTVGADSVAADAEMCMLAADTLEALGIARGDYVIKVNSRKVLDGVMDSIGLGGEGNAAKRLIVLRAIDKLDRLGPDNVRQLLGPGRTDESGDFTKGAGLTEDQIHEVMTLMGSRPALSENDKDLLDWELADSVFVGGDIAGSAKGQMYFETQTFSEPGPGRAAVSNAATIKKLRAHFSGSEVITQGLDELEQIAQLVKASKYGSKRIRIDPSVVRGLEYYTGPVFEAELTFEVKDEKGNPVRFGSVGGGGRYDDLVARFTGQKVPATGFSIGISRLQAALETLGSAKAAAPGPVIVTVMEKERLADYQRMVQKLRDADIRAELYLGNPKKFGKQLEYADKRGAPCVVIQGSDEREAGVVTLKDLVAGAEAAEAISDHKEWKELRPAQISVPESKMIEAVLRIIRRPDQSNRSMSETIREWVEWAVCGAVRTWDKFVAWSSGRVNKVRKILARHGR